MNVQFTVTTRASLNDLPIANGQLVYLSDENAAFYDMGNSRRPIATIRKVAGLPQTGYEGILYINTNDTPNSTHVWVDGNPSGSFVQLAGKIASANDFGLVKVDGTTITANSGVISCGYDSDAASKLAGIQSGATATSFTRTLTSGEEIGVLTINGVGTTLYAPSATAGSVTGVKGNSETTYRTGNVNITPTDIGLGSVGNFKAVSTAANQGLDSTEQSNARANIGAGTSNFSGSYDDLSNKPTIPTAVAVKGNAESSYRTGNVNLTAANIFKEVSGTLAANATSITLSNSTITTSSTIDVYCSDAMSQYTGMTISAGKVVITFDASSSARTVKVRVS